MTRLEFQQQIIDIKQRHGVGNRGLKVLESMTVLLEQVICEAFDEAAKTLPTGNEEVSILGTGGFGRRELHPHSDVDIILFFGQPIQADHETFLKALLHPLWDLGLSIGHHVLHPLQYDFDPRNLELATALLDIRLIAGNPRPYAYLKHEELPRLLERRGKDFLRSLVAGKEDRHKRYNETIYQLEPDIKEAPGGLRDLQVARWIARILFGCEDLWQLADVGLFSLEGLQQIREAQLFLLELRNDLHFLTGRNRNVLSHEVQLEIAAERSYAGSECQRVESLMKDYFLKAKLIQGFCESMTRRAFPPARRVSRTFNPSAWSTTIVRRGALYFADENVIVKHPANMLKLFYRSSKYQLPVSEEALDQVKKHLRRIDDSVRASAEVRDLFLKLLRQQQNVYQVLFLMHDIGLLGQIFPEFDKIRCHVIQDFFHKYTVDEHSLLTIKNIEDLYHATKPREQRFGSLLRSLERPDLVLFALLFHDVGKAAVGNHCDNSLIEFDRVATRMRLTEDDTKTIRFLIRYHLEMSNTFQRRDITDESVVKRFAEFIGTQENLRTLCLLTYADIKAVSPEALTPWKEDVLWQLYVETEAQLTRAFADERWDTLQDESIAQEVADLLGDQESLGRVEGFLDGFPRRYLRFTSKRSIAEHFRLAEKLSTEQNLAFKLNRYRSTYELNLVAMDRPYLFATLTGVLSYFGMNILRGQAFANRRGVILDVIQFEDRLQTFKLNKSEIENFRLTLRRVLAGEQSLSELLRKRESSILFHRKAKGVVSTRISFDDLSSERYTILEILSRDRYGLLSTIAQVIARSNCNIDVALISTEGHQAIDVFYLTENGKKLSLVAQKKLATKMKEMLDGLAV